jgi:tetratricopeptide (TPR) repeat protein
VESKFVATPSCIGPDYSIDFSLAMPHGLTHLQAAPIGATIPARTLEVPMKHSRWAVAVMVLLPLVLSVFARAQLDNITIPAGTPEDQALTVIANEQDPQKKLAMYQDFLQKFAANPAAVAYGNWQISQSYQAAGDPQKALEYGDKALAGSPHNLDILVSQAGIAQQLKDYAKVMDYSTQGGTLYNSIPKETKAAASEKDTDKSSYEFLEAAAFNAIAAEPDATKRMAYIESFTSAFPNSQFQAQITSYAMMSLSQLKDTPRLLAYADKTLATDPNNLPALLLLAGAYTDDPKPGSLTKAIGYAQKAIDVAKADAPDADHNRKVSAGAAHSTLGYDYMKQDKTSAAIPELKTASGLLKGQDDQQYAIAMYRLGYAYAKLSRTTEAREVLLEVVKISGPVQQPAQDLLAKVNAARSKGK